MDYLECSYSFDLSQLLRRSIFLALCSRIFPSWMLDFYVLPLCLARILTTVFIYVKTWAYL